MSAVKKSTAVSRIRINNGSSATFGFSSVGWELQVFEVTASTVPLITGTINGVASVALGEAAGVYRCEPGLITVTASVADCYVEFRAVADISSPDGDAINYMWPPVGDDPANTGSTQPVAGTAYLTRYTVPDAYEFSGVAVAVGSTASGTTKGTAVIYDADGVLLAQSATAGTTINASTTTTMMFPLVNKLRGTHAKTLWVGVVYGDTGTHYATRKSVGYTTTYAALCDPATGTAPPAKITIPTATASTTPYKICLG